MKILCGTDFSSSARAAAEVAACIAQKLKAPLKLVHCVSDWLAPAEYPVAHTLSEQDQALMDAEVSRVCAPDQKVETKVLYGSASHHLVAEAQAETAMVVMGATGKGTTKRLLVGSVAEHVAETVTAPTLLVRNSEPLLHWLQNGKELKVLCASDIAESETALLTAISELRPLGPLDLECAHFVQMNARMIQSGKWDVARPDLTTPTNDETAAIQQRVKQKFVQAAGLEPRQVHVHASWGNPAYDLVALAHETKADLIIVGSHHKHGFERVKHPSFSRRVLAHADTNTLCVYLGAVETELETPVPLKGKGTIDGVSVRPKPQAVS